jgi:ABC-type phosphate transport system substrate-binding protein
MRKSLQVALVGATVAACGLGMVGTANADNQPRVTDIVGVGSDTVQYLGDFLADGDNVGSSGYNTNNPSRRMFNIDATADAAGRAVYGAAGSAGTAINPQVVLRAGLSPVARPNGSGAGIAAINTDAAHSIDFVRSSRLPKAAEQGVSVATSPTATSPGTPALGSLHSFQVAVDGLQMATATVTNAPNNLTCQNIVDIYKGLITNWSTLGGTAGTIVAVKPQNGSGTLSDFTSVLTACNGGVPMTFGAGVVIGEEHDPSAIAGNPNAIAPFSSGRFNLLQSGYLSTYTLNSIKLQGTPVIGTTVTSTAPDVFYQARKLFIIVRDGDVNSTIPFQNGSTLNWVKTLFGTTTSWAGKPASSGLFTSSGVIQAFSDQGLTTSG